MNILRVSLIFLALYGALRLESDPLMVDALPFAAIGIAVYLAVNQALSMLSPTANYASAASSAEQKVFEATGKALLEITRAAGVVFFFGLAHCRQAAGGNGNVRNGVTRDRLLRLAFNHWNAVDQLMILSV